MKHLLVLVLITISGSSWAYPVISYVSRSDASEACEKRWAEKFGPDSFYVCYQDPEDFVSNTILLCCQWPFPDCPGKHGCGSSENINMGFKYLDSEQSGDIETLEFLSKSFATLLYIFGLACGFAVPFAFFR